MKLNHEFFVFLVFLALAVGFWFLQAYNETTTVTASYRLVLANVPKNVVLQSLLPSSVSVNVTGKGFYVMPYAGHDDDSLVVDFLSLPVSSGKAVIDNSVWKDLFKAKATSGVSFSAYTPSQLEIFFTREHHKRVPVLFDKSKILTDKDHRLSDVRLSPSAVDVYAPMSMLDSLSVVQAHYAVTDLADTTRVLVGLQHINGVKCVPDSIMVTLCVDFVTSKSVVVPIGIENVPQDQVIRLFPNVVTVSFCVGTGQYDYISERDFEAVVDYSSINFESKTCRLRLRKQPNGIDKVRLSPEEVEFIVEH